MRRTNFVLTAAFLLFNIIALSQQVSFSGKNVPLKKVFAEIEKQTGYAVTYTSDILTGAKPVSINVEKMALVAFLEKVLVDQPIGFVMGEKTVMLVRKVVNRDGKMYNNVFVPVKGKVTDTAGRSLAGATIMVKNSKVSAVTDRDGIFSVNITDDDVLLISYIGYETRQVIVSSSMYSSASNLIITLTPAVTKLDDVEVTVSTGYQKLTREKATGSFSLVDNKLLNRSVSPDVLSRIKSVASGVLFDPSVDNNLGISIRGRSTIYGNTQPLIILDNLPFQGLVNEINPNDVESITILKDAAASAMWGALSGNGVIVITTKKGKNNQPVKVSLNANFTITEKPDLFYNQQFMNPSDFINMEIDLFSKGWYNGDLASPTGTPVSPVVDILNQRAKGLISSADSASQIDGLRKYDIRNDYSKYFYRPAVLQQYFLNLSGGNDKSNYYISAGYDKELQNVRYNDNDRVSLNAQMTFIPHKNIELSGGMMFNLSNVNSDGMSSIFSTGKNLNIYPYARLADENGSPLPVIKDFSMAFVNNPAANGLLDWRYIPLEEHRYTTLKGKTTSNRINAGLKYNIIPSLSVQFSYLRQSTISNSERFADQNAYSTRNTINQYSVVTSGIVTGRNVPLGGIYSYTANESISQSGRSQLNYSQNFGVHSINAISGIDVIDAKTTSEITQVYGYDPNTGTSIPVNFQTRYRLYPYGTESTVLGSPTIIPYTQDRFRSFFSNVSYSFADKYLFFISGKMDQSNLFGVKTNQKTVPLWSVGTRWNISKENFYNIGWLPMLNLKATYGYNGNYDKSVSALSVIEYFSENINGQPYSAVKTVGNPQLRWEKISMLNLAVEFQLRNGIISGSIEYYRRKGVDMIGNSALPSSSGFNGIRGNFSDMKASGIDLVLNTNNLKGAFNWYSNILMSFTTNRITKNEGRNLQMVGNPVQGIYTYRWAGLDAFTGDPIGYLSGALSKNYTAIIREVSNDYSKFIYSGSASPRFFGGIRNTFSWKELTLSANISFKAGYYFLANTISYSQLINFGLAHRDYEKRWQKKGDETQTNVPSFVFPVNADRDNFYQRSEVNVTKGDHIRLQDISISYDVNRDKNKMLPFLKQIRIYAYLNNLGLLWNENDRGLDPDFTSGFVTPRAFSLGCNVSF